MWVQVSGMIGANSESRRALTKPRLMLTAGIVYQPEDKPRYFKANTGLLVICIWMCVSTTDGACGTRTQALTLDGRSFNIHSPFTITGGEINARPIGGIRCPMRNRTITGKQQRTKGTKGMSLISIYSPMLS